MGPGKILSGIKDVTEKILATCAQFVVDGPPDIRWINQSLFIFIRLYLIQVIYAYKDGMAVKYSIC